MPYQNVGMSLGRAIKTLREEADKTQQQVADHLNKRLGGTRTQSMMSRWENDKADGSPDLQEVALLEDFCGRPRGTIYRRLGYVADAATPEDAIKGDKRLSRRDAQIALAFYSTLVSGPAVSAKKAVQAQRARRK